VDLDSDIVVVATAVIVADVVAVVVVVVVADVVVVACTPVDTCRRCTDIEVAHNLARSRKSMENPTSANTPCDVHPNIRTQGGAELTDEKTIQKITRSRILHAHKCFCIHTNAP
jgi:hypothetical protein